MFIPKKAQPAPSKLTTEIDRVYSQLNSTDPTDPGYAKLLATAEQLTKLQKSDEKNFWNDVSADAVVAAAASIAGIVMILTFERTHIMTSKALSFVFKHKA